MKRENLVQLYQQLKTIQLEIENSKTAESHLETNRLLKLIDAELLDALHNMETLLEHIPNTD